MTTPAKPPVPFNDDHRNEALLVLELIGASTSMSAFDYETYATDRLAPVIAHATPEYLADLIMIAAAMASATIENWAEDTGRSPQDVLQPIRAQMSKEAGF